MSEDSADPGKPDEILSKLTWLFLLLPGFVCVSMVGGIVELPELSEFQFTCYCLMASILCGLIAWPVSVGANWLLAKVRAAPSPTRVTYIFFTASLGFAVLLGIAFGLAAQDDALLRFVRAMPGGALDKTSHKRPFVLLMGHINNANTPGGGLRTHGADGRPHGLQQEKAYIRMRVKDDGPIFEGRPHYFAHGNEASEIYLSPACRVDDRNIVERIPGPGVVVMESEIQYVEVIDVSASQCRTLYFPLPP